MPQPILLCGALGLLAAKGSRTRTGLRLRGGRGSEGAFLHAFRTQALADLLADGLRAHVDSHLLIQVEVAGLLTTSTTRTCLSARCRLPLGGSRGLAVRRRVLRGLFAIRLRWGLGWPRQYPLLGGVGLPFPFVLLLDHLNCHVLLDLLGGDWFFGDSHRFDLALAPELLHMALCGSRVAPAARFIFGTTEEARIEEASLLAAAGDHVCAALLHYRIARCGSRLDRLYTNALSADLADAVVHARLYRRLHQAKSKDLSDHAPVSFKLSIRKSIFRAIKHPIWKPKFFAIR